MNTLTLSGTVVAAPERKTFAGGASLVAVVVAVERPGKDGAIATDEVRVETWGRVAERAGRLVPGQRVIVGGTLRASSWTNSEGRACSRLFVSANALELLAPEGAGPAAVRDDSEGLNAG